MRKRRYSKTQILAFRFPHKLIVLIVGIVIFFSLDAQNVSRKHLNDKHKTYYDSLKNMTYDRVFPIYGTKVYKRGFDIPFPFGIMLNTFYGRQGIDITNVRVGIQGPNNVLGPVNLDSIIQFGDVNATALNLNLRADCYLFPFLNVYLMLNYFPYSQTEVNLVKPIELKADPKQSGWAYGFGLMGAFGFGPVWFQGDYSLNWADMELLENKVFTQIAGVRMGHVFPGKKDPESNISIWVGAMGIFLNNRTVGSIKFTEIFPQITEDQVNEARTNYNNHNGITPLQKQVMDEITQRILDRIHDLPLDESYITYELDKAPSSKWAGLVGMQYQFNKRWQLRSESNFIGKDRLSILLSINYRFMGFKKKVPK
jgi:hypothetical protein